MAKMLDLTVFQEQYFELKLMDGTLLHIRKPSQKLLIQFIALKEAGKQEKNTEQQLDNIYTVVVNILNNNKEGKVYTKDDIADYDVAILSKIIEAYVDFMNEIMNDPN